MSLLRSSPALPRHTAMLISPWLLVGSALILAMAIAFWAVKNTRQERENMARNLVERAGALMWAMEGGARAGMGLQRTAYYLQFMLEEVGRQPDIIYLAVITPQGDIVAHSDPGAVGKRLYSPEGMLGLEPGANIQWRFVQLPGGVRMFESYRRFMPLPGFSRHKRHETRDSGLGGPMMGMMSGRKGRMLQQEGAPMPPSAFPPAPPSAFSPTPAPPPPFAAPGEIPVPGMPVPPPQMPDPQSVSPAEAFGAETFPPPPPGGLTVIVGLDMAPFEAALVTGDRNTLFTALLVGLLGVGGFLSLFWAQSYKMSRRMLLDARAFADEVISSLPMGLLIVDADGAVAQINAVAEKLLGCSNTALLGKNVSGLPGGYWAEIMQKVRSGKAVLEEEHALTLACDRGVEDGNAVPVSISASGIINEEGEVLGTLYLLRDLREVKRLQAELRRSERMSTLGNMAARVAHEIRNPLSSIKGFATYLASRHQDKGDREAAQTMIGEVDRLNRVVSELLDFARPSNLTIAPVVVGDIIERAVRLAHMDAEAKGVTLGSGAETAVPVVVAVDAERVTQALLNLLLNAVQATDRGGAVTISVAPPENGWCVLRISDSGRGMTPEVLSQVFSPYFTTRATGTGLGLSIVSKIIEDHQGTIHMLSTPGEGTAVTVRLPLAASECVEMRAPPAPARDLQAPT